MRLKFKSKIRVQQLGGTYEWNDYYSEIFWKSSAWEIKQIEVFHNLEKSFNKKDKIKKIKAFSKEKSFQSSNSFKLWLFLTK